MGYGAPLPSTPSIRFPLDATFAIVGAGKTHVTCEMVDQSRATGEDPILKYAKYVHNAFKLTGNEVLYFTHMNPVANKPSSNYHFSLFYCKFLHITCV